MPKTESGIIVFPKCGFAKVEGLETLVVAIDDIDVGSPVKVVYSRAG